MVRKGDVAWDAYVNVDLKLWYSPQLQSKRIGKCEDANMCIENSVAEFGVGLKLLLFIILSDKVENLIIIR